MGLTVLPKIRHKFNNNMGYIETRLDRYDGQPWLLFNNNMGYIETVYNSKR